MCDGAKCHKIHQTSLFSEQSYWTWALPCNLKHFHTCRTIWLLKHILSLYDIMSLRRDLKIQELNQVTEITYDQNLNVIVYVLIVYISQPIHPQGSSLSGHIIFTELFSLEIIQLGLPRLSPFWCQRSRRYHMAR